MRALIAKSQVKSALAEAVRRLQPVRDGVSHRPHPVTWVIEVTSRNGAHRV